MLTVHSLHDYRWEFKTDYHNIAFGVIKVIKNNDGTEENYEVVRFSW